MVRQLVVVILYAVALWATATVSGLAVGVAIESAWRKYHG